MRTYGTLGLIIIALLAGQSMAQDRCGAILTPEEIQRALDRYGQGRGPTTPTSTEPLVITIAWHVLESTDGDRAMDDDQLQAALDMLNERWQPVNIMFAAHPLVDRIIDDDLFHNGVPDANEFRSKHPLPNALNIYWAPILQNGQLCGIAGYSFSALDTIAMQTSCFGETDVSGILTHELGHWFDLFHTFEHALGRECVARTNCDFAGDFCCDTPADFNLEFDTCVNADGCRLRTGECSEQPGPCDGDPYYSPSTINYMSYTVPVCLSEFTVNQYTRMRSNTEQHRADWINTGLHEPCPADVTNDYLIDISDLLTVIDAFGNCETSCPNDLDDNGIINVLDLLIVFDAWGDCFECTDPFGCDDGDPSTIDTCWYGTCLHELENH